MALRVDLTSTASFPAASEYSAPAAVASAVLSTPRPAHKPYTRSLRWRKCPITGNVKRASAPRARIAAMEKEESSSSASMDPFVAMMAITSQSAEHTSIYQKSVGLGLNTTRDV